MDRKMRLVVVGAWIREWMGAEWESADVLYAQFREWLRRRGIEYAEGARGRTLLGRRAWANDVACLADAERVERRRSHGETLLRRA